VYESVRFEGLRWRLEAFCQRSQREKMQMRSAFCGQKQVLLASLGGFLPLL